MKFASIATARGFTIVELLVVVSVIGVLAALVVPALSGGMQSSRESANISNLRQIAVAMNLYAAENEDRYPVGYNTTTYVSYVGLLGPYTGQTNGTSWTARKSIFVSPTAPVRIGSGVNRPTHYAVNELICAGPNSGFSMGGVPFDTPIRRISIPRPTEVILVADAPQSETGGNSPATYWNPWNVSWGFWGDLNAFIPANPANDVDAGPGRGWFRYRNRGSVHAAMVDGSVKSFKRGTVQYRNVVAYQ
jgi:prepilin-type N-terminal cleavage/methylation domain-containing protein